VTLDVVATGSAGKAYVLKAGSDALLLDCGARWRDIQAALDFDTANVAGCLVTHEHGDHTRALHDVLRAGIDCYMSKGTAAKKNVAGHRTRAVSALQGFSAGRFMVYPFQTEHDAAEPMGFLISHGLTGEKLVYATDTFYLRYAFENVNYYIVECNYCTDTARERLRSGELDEALYARLTASHFSLERLIDFFASCDLRAARKIVLIHLSGGNSDERRMVREVGGATGTPTEAADAGARINLELRPF